MLQVQLYLVPFCTLDSMLRFVFIEIAKLTQYPWNSVSYSKKKGFFYLISIMGRKLPNMEASYFR